MKNIIIFALILLGSNGYAQKVDTSSYAKKVEYLFGNVQKPTKAGIWYDKVMPWAGLHIFGQNGRKDTSSLKHFKQSIYEMEVASNQKRDATYSFVLRNWMYHQNKQILCL